MNRGPPGRDGVSGDLGVKDTWEGDRDLGVSLYERGPQGLIPLSSLGLWLNTKTYSVVLSGSGEQAALSVALHVRPLCGFLSLVYFGLIFIYIQYIYIYTCLHI